MFFSKKFIVLFLVSLIGFTLAFNLSETILTAKPPLVNQQLAVVQHESTPISRRAEGNTS